MNRKHLPLLLCLPILIPAAACGANDDDVRHVTASSGVVVSVSADASDAGLGVLRRGGNAVDAAVATAFALAVTHPAAGNLGGGGFMMVRLAATGEVTNIEYRETAPQSANRDSYVKLSDVSRGHLSVGVPGTVRGLATAHARFGKLPWRDLVEPAVRLADAGFAVDAPLARSLNGVIPAARPYPEFGRVFGKPDGSKWQAGDRMAQRDLAQTLRQIAEHGADAFYTGAIADQIVAEMSAGGGLIAKADLAAYRANVRQPIHGTFRGYDIYAPPPPSSGGVALVEMLNILEQFPLREQGRWSAATTHQLVEAMRRAYLDRARFLGDPAFSDVPVARLASKSYAKELAAAISADRATPSHTLAPDIALADEGNSTTHFSVIDHAGNAVANTYTLQDSYGSYIVVRGAGFLLNNEITDFNLQPGRTTRAGQIGTDANLVAPHKRMLSSQTPTIVCRDGRVVLVTGTPGGRTIINTVLQVVLNVIEFDMPIADAVAAPRLHHQWLPDTVRYEPGQLAPEALMRLEAMGHRLVRIERQGDAHSIWVAPRTGQYRGVADGRISGKAAGY